MAEKWNGFDTEKFDFNGREAIVVFAAEENRTAKWLMKTEYFGAFPNAEIELVRRGFNLALLQTKRAGARIPMLTQRRILCAFLRINTDLKKNAPLWA